MEGIITDHLFRKKLFLIFEYTPINELGDKYENNGNMFMMSDNGEYSIFRMPNDIKYSFNFEEDMLIITQKNKEYLKKIYMKNELIRLYSGREKEYSDRIPYYNVKWGEYLEYSSFYDICDVKLYNSGELYSINFNYFNTIGVDLTESFYTIFYFYIDGRIESLETKAKTPYGYEGIGDHIYYHENGNMKKRIKYIITPGGNQMKRDEEYDLEGNVTKIINYDIEGKNFSVYGYTNSITYYPNKVVKSYGYYLLGEKIGFHVTLYPSGKIKTMYGYLYDVLQGPFFENDPSGNTSLAGYYVNGLLEGFYLEKEGGQVKQQGVYEIRGGVSIKTGYWLEMEEGELIEVYYGLTKEIISFPPVAT